MKSAEEWIETDKDSSWYDCDVMAKRIGIETIQAIQQDARTSGFKEGLERAACYLDGYDILYERDDVADMVQNEIRDLLPKEESE